jgi:ETFB lysine methyltransferase
VTDLEQRFRTSVTAVDVAGRAASILHPANSDDLITEADYVKDERLPYWADLWPSAYVLAAQVAGMSGAGRSLLELGCGAGLVSVAARMAGFDVLATDYYEDALLFARENVRRNGLGDLAVRHVDWRAFPTDLGRFDVVVASDVLYEHAYAPLLADAFRLTLAPGALGLVADPGRIAAPAFLTECAERSLGVTVAVEVPWTDGTVHQTIRVYRVGG